MISVHFQGNPFNITVIQVYAPISNAEEAEVEQFYEVPSITGCCFCFGSVTSFFLELFLNWSPVADWAPTDLGSSSFSVLSFCLFMLSMGFSRQEYRSGLPLPSPVHHILSELSTMASPSWMALQGIAHSFIELDKAVIHMISLATFLWLWFSFCLPSDE